MGETDKQGITTRELVELSIISAMMFVCKEAMSAIPNVHPVVPFILITVILYGWKTLYPVYVFAILEIMVYGVYIWNLMYFYVWTVLVIIAMPFRQSRNWVMWAAIASIYGFCFGALCSIPYIFVSGLRAAFAFWIAGIPYDIVHGISNFFMTLLLLPLMYKVSLRIRSV